MKTKTHILPAILTVGILAFGGCSENPGENVPHEDKVILTLMADSPATRTFIDGEGTEANPFVINWEESVAEEIGVFVLDAEAPTSNAKFTGAVDPTTKIATFSGAVNRPAATSPLPLYAYYPYDSGIDGTAGEWTVLIPQYQKASSTGFDPKGNIMIAEPLDIDPEVFGSSSNMRFKHKNVFLRVKAGEIENSTGVEASELVKSVTINARDTRITGKYTVNLTDPDLLMKETPLVTDGYTSVLLEIDQQYRQPLGTFNNGWLCIGQSTIAPGEEWEITIETDTHLIKKTFSPGEELMFKEGNAYVMTMAIDEQAVITPSQGVELRTAQEEVWSENGLGGQYLLVGKNNEGVWYAGSTMDGYYIRPEMINIVDGAVRENFAGEYDEWIFTVERKEEAGDNMYTIRFQNKYIASVSNLTNGFRFYDQEDTTGNSTTFSINYPDERWEIKSRQAGALATIRFYIIGNYTFRCMAGLSTATDVYLYKVN